MKKLMSVFNLSEWNFDGEELYRRFDRTFDNVGIGILYLLGAVALFLQLRSVL